MARAFSILHDGTPASCVSGSVLLPAFPQGDPIYEIRRVFEFLNIRLGGNNHIYRYDGAEALLIDESDSFSPMSLICSFSISNDASPMLQTVWP
ncbi:MAG: hypothetical protein ACYC7E_00390 [Armatimonadota bacterium]